MNDNNILTDEDRALFKRCCWLVREHATGNHSTYAKTYAARGMQLAHDESIIAQAQYIAANLAGWRGEMAAQVKKDLKSIIGKGR